MRGEGDAAATCFNHQICEHLSSLSDYTRYTGLHVPRPFFLSLAVFGFCPYFCIQMYLYVYIGILGSVASQLQWVIANIGRARGAEGGGQEGGGGQLQGIPDALSYEELVVKMLPLMREAATCASITIIIDGCVWVCIDISTSSQDRR